HSYRGRPGFRDRNVKSLYLSHGFSLFEFWLCCGHVVRDAPHHKCDQRGVHEDVAGERNSGLNRMKRSATQIPKFVLLMLMLVAALAPIYWLVTISFKREVDQFARPPKWFVFTPTLEHYADAFLTRAFGHYLFNSLMVAALSTACALIIGTLAAYSLARFRLPHRLDRHLALWILSTRMFPAI